MNKKLIFVPYRRDASLLPIPYDCTDAMHRVSTPPKSHLYHLLHSTPKQKTLCFNTAFSLFCFCGNR